MGSTPTRVHGGTSVMHATTVADAMHHGIVACQPSATLPEVARTMVLGNLHCVAIVSGGQPGASRLHAVITDLDLLRWAAGANAHRPARQIARSPAIKITPDTSLYEATELMVDHHVDHLVVTDTDGGTPVGILSSLDVARALARTPRAEL
jgi:CBS domain-containing protein